MKLEHKYDRLYKILTIIGSLICMAFFGMAAIEENFLREWKKFQWEFKELLLSQAADDKQRELAQEFPIEIRQVLLDDFKRVDRCVSCHNGIDNPNMAGEALPHAAHSGDYLQNHPVEKFGCSICHGGQDRALAIKSAFAKDEGAHWAYPVLPLRYVESSCGKCHLAVFDQNQYLAGAEVLMQGREIFYREGCLGCHNVRGAGGTFSFELTDQGSKTKYQYSFKHVDGEFTVQNWLREHFLNPQKVAGVSEMPPIVLNDDEMDALITFTMGLHAPKYRQEYYALEALSEFKGRRHEFSGPETYQAFCAVCHGENGEGKDYRVFEASVPKLNSQDFLAVASQDMIRFTITKGRSGRTMSSWEAANGGLTANEIESLVHLIAGWKAEPPSFTEVQAAAGKVATGAALFRSRCGTCHGSNGEGGIGPSLNNQDLLALASDEFLYKTLVLGRRNTAMPSWSHLTTEELASILAYLRSWQRVPSVALSSRTITGNLENGKTLFAGMCSGCHGRHGQGTVGSAILNQDFLAAASDEFVYRSMSRGREQSAMRSWARERQGMEQLAQQEMNDIVAFIRSQEHVQPKAIYSNVTAGSPSIGKVMFEGMCAGCHGMNGEGKHGPALNNQEFLSAATDGFLQATIALGRSGTAMRSWAKGAQGFGELSAAQINDIVSYLRTWQREVIPIATASADKERGRLVYGKSRTTEEAPAGGSR